MIRILLLFLTFTFAGELEVEGDLKVSGNIDAQNNPIKNVGTPLLDTDATNLVTVQNMIGMKPDRIYTYRREDSCDNFDFTVPEGKVWLIKTSSSLYLYINNNFNVNYYLEPSSSLTLFSNNSIHGNDNSCERVILNIYEYPISGSGTDQGMDYVEP